MQQELKKLGLKEIDLQALLELNRIYQKLSPIQKNKKVKQDYLTEFYPDVIIKKLQSLFPETYVDAEQVKPFFRQKFKSGSLQNSQLETIEKFSKKYKSQKITKKYPNLCIRLLSKVAEKYSNQEDTKILQEYSKIYQFDPEYYKKYHCIEKIHEPKFQLQKFSQNFKGLIHDFQVIKKNPLLRNFCDNIKSGTFTSKIDSLTGNYYPNISQVDIKQWEKSINGIYKFFPFSISVSFTFPIYRFIRLPHLPAVIINKLPTSWTFEQSYAQFWFSSHSQPNLQNYILKVEIQSDKDYYLLNVRNLEQAEIILLPCRLIVEKVTNKFMVNYVECIYQFV